MLITNKILLKWLSGNSANAIQEYEENNDILNANIVFFYEGTISQVPIDKQTANTPNDNIDKTVYNISILRPSQNGHYFANDILKCIFLNENLWILYIIWLEYVPYSLIDDTSTLVQAMVWCQTGNKPEPMLTQCNDAHMRHPVSMC